MLCINDDIRELKLKNANRLSSDSESDQYLIDSTLGGNLKAFEVLVRRYQKLVYNVLYQMARSHETASDLTQDTFLKSFKALSSFKRGAPFKPWLLRIATNSCLNFIRDTKNTDSLDELMDAESSFEPAYTDSFEERVDASINQQVLFSALEKLSVRHRTVFVLRYQHDLVYEDICTATGETLASVKSILFRSRERLRRLILEGGVESDTTGPQKGGEKE